MATSGGECCGSFERPPCHGIRAVRFDSYKEWMASANQMPLKYTIATTAQQLRPATARALARGTLSTFLCLCVQCSGGGLRFEQERLGLTFKEVMQCAQISRSGLRTA